MSMYLCSVTHVVTCSCTDASITVSLLQPWQGPGPRLTSRPRRPGAILLTERGGVDAHTWPTLNSLMYRCTCMSICIYIDITVYVYDHVHVHVPVRVHVDACVCAYVYVQVYVYVCVYEREDVYDMCMDMYICTCMYRWMDRSIDT